MDNRRPVWGLCWLHEKLSTFKVQYDLVRQVGKTHIDMFNVFPYLCLTEGLLIVQRYMQTAHCLFSFVELLIGVFLKIGNAEVSTKPYMKSADKVHVLLIFSNWARLEKRTFRCSLQCNWNWYQLTAGAEFPFQSNCALCSKKTISLIAQSNETTCSDKRNPKSCSSVR